MDETLNKRCAAFEALMELKRQLNSSLAWAPLYDMSELEERRFKDQHPGALCVVGDFEIRCLNPPKYHLNG